jgi:hypothetical protein
MAEALVQERRDELLARAKASGVVQDELLMQTRRSSGYGNLHEILNISANEKARRHNDFRCTNVMLKMGAHQCHAQNGGRNDSQLRSREHR